MKHSVLSKISFSSGLAITAAFAAWSLGAAARAVCLLVGLLSAPCLRAQSPDEHASHRPGAAGAGEMPAMPGADTPMSAMPAAEGGLGPGGMGPPTGVGPQGGKGAMMKAMGAPPPKELYPTLMALSELTPAKRHEVPRRADERIHAGATLIAFIRSVAEAANLLTSKQK